MLRAALLCCCGEDRAWFEHGACCATVAAWWSGLGNLLMNAHAGPCSVTQACTGPWDVSIH